MENPTAQGTIEIDAPPELVYELITDITALPDWAVEADRCAWLDGATGAAVGARFRGRNRHKRRRWSTTCTVTAADPGRRFTFDVVVVGTTSATWEYEIEPTQTGCRVTERTKRRVPLAAAKLVNLLMLGIRDRDGHNQANIERTLANLKDYAEARARTRTEG